MPDRSVDANYSGRFSSINHSGNENFRWYKFWVVSASQRRIVPDSPHLAHTQPRHPRHPNRSAGSARPLESAPREVAKFTAAAEDAWPDTEPVPLHPVLKFVGANPFTVRFPKPSVLPRHLQPPARPKLWLGRDFAARCTTENSRSPAAICCHRSQASRRFLSVASCGDWGG